VDADTLCFGVALTVLYIKTKGLGDGLVVVTAKNQYRHERDADKDCENRK